MRISREEKVREIIINQKSKIIRIDCFCLIQIKESD
jgi:hypothetical protein